ncbi:MAG: DUF1501 domain-containing protein [Planctomycetota bacterium]
MKQPNQEKGSARKRYELSRRRFLANSGAVASAAAASTLWTPKLAIGSQGTSVSPTLIVIFLRGGADGLTWVAPVNDTYYSDRRVVGQTRIEPPGAGARGWLNESDGWALPPGAVDEATSVDLKVPYGNGDLVFVHGTGLTGNGRSHFEAMNFLEWGITPGTLPPGTPGWFARYMEARMSMGSLLGVGLGPTLPVSLAGAPKTKAVDDLQQVSFPGWIETAGLRRTAIEDSYSGHPNLLLKTGAADAFAALDALSNVTYGPCPADYPRYPATQQITPFAQSMCDLATLLKSGAVELDSAHLNFGGWDHHNAQRPLAGPDPDTFFTMSWDVSKTLAAFYNDMGGSAGTSKYIVAVVTEFGRRIAENNSEGTDHGTGGVAMVMGDGVSTGAFAGKVFYRDWDVQEGIEELLDPTHPEDLKITHDIRHVLGEILNRRYGIGGVFPNFQVEEQGIVGIA